MTPKFELGTRNSKLEIRSSKLEPGGTQQDPEQARPRRAADSRFRGNDRLGGFGSRISNFEYRVLSFEFRVSTEKGVALLAVMCAITVLVLVAMAFSGSVQLETRTAIYHKEAAQAYAMATGGIQSAIFEIAYPLPMGQEEDKPRGWVEGQRLAQVNYRNGMALVKIVNETGKLDLNAADPKQLQSLFVARGMEAEEAGRLAAAIKHWRTPAGANDPESTALDDYYRAAGYSATHGPFGSVEEALRVRGMSRDIFYGTAFVRRDHGIESIYGVGQDLTIFSGSAQVNVNYASEALLQSVPGMGPDLARAIVEERSKQPFKTMDDLSQRLAVSLPDEAGPILTTTTCDFYSIVAVGEVSGSRVRRTVKAVVQVTPQSTAQHHQIIAWYDDVEDQDSGFGIQKSGP
jgi:general secretion pathway protein K